MRFSRTFGLFALTMMSQRQAKPLRSTQKRCHLPRASASRIFWWLAFVDLSQKSSPSDGIKRSAIKYCENDQDCICDFIMEHWYGLKN